MTSKLSYVPLLADDLRALGACESEVLLFEQRFPNGATPDDAPRADGLNVEWLLQIIDLDAYKAIRRPALEAYEVIERPAREAYEVAIQSARSAREAYKAIEQPAWEAYKAIEQPAWEAYEAIEQPAWEAYNAAIRTASLDALRVVWPVWEE